MDSVERTRKSSGHLSKRLKGKKRARDESQEHDKPELSEYERNRASSSSLSPVPDQVPEPRPALRRKRAETRACPVCLEQIPLRLLSVHADLESERVDTIIKAVGDTQVLADAYDNEGEDKPRRSAARARLSMRSRSGNTVPGLSPEQSTPGGSLDECMKSIQGVHRRRKRRHGRLKEMAKDTFADDYYDSRLGSSAIHGGVATRFSRRAGEQVDETVCPVCLQKIAGDEDVVDAHVDACLAFEASRAQQRGQEEEQQRRELNLLVDEEDQEIDVGGDGEFIGNISSARGTNFYLRDRTLQDVEDDIDVDGDDEDQFGHAQFNEGDIINLSISNPVDNTDSSSLPRAPTDEGQDDDDETGTREQTLQDLVAQGKILRKSVLHGPSGSATSIKEVDAEITLARVKVDTAPRAMILALEKKIRYLESTSPHLASSSSPHPHAPSGSTSRAPSDTNPNTNPNMNSNPNALSFVCRICLDPYEDPTVSTGCWHTCCRECWLRCLGTTKLCPICKRITAAGELRRVYL